MSREGQQCVCWGARRFLHVRHRSRRSVKYRPLLHVTVIFHRVDIDVEALVKGVVMHDREVGQHLIGRKDVVTEEDFDNISAADVRIITLFGATGTPFPLVIVGTRMTRRTAR